MTKIKEIRTGVIGVIHGPEPRLEFTVKSQT